MAEPLSLIAVVDVETTGFPPDAAMVEIARTNVRLFPEGWGVEGETASRFVNPGRPIPPAASAIHHIIDEDVVDGISAEEAIRFATAGADFLCAHNVEFDSQFVKQHRLPWICTLKGARHAWPEMDSHANMAIRYARHLCLDREQRVGAHRAGADTMVTAHILVDLLRELSVEKLVDLSRKPSLLLRMPFGKHRGERFADLPWDYLQWVVTKSDLKDDIKASARAELARRAA